VATTFLVFADFASFLLDGLATFFALVAFFGLAIFLLDFPADFFAGFLPPFFLAMLRPRAGCSESRNWTKRKPLNLPVTK